MHSLWLTFDYYLIVLMFIEIRNRYLNGNCFKELLEKVPPDSILSYLHEIGLFYRL